jgi:hypothetical protein
MLALRGPADAAVFLIADAGMAREAAGTAAASVPASGDFGRAGPLPLAGAFRKGEPVRLPEGVAVREGGLLGRLIVGLSQEVKKSSSFSAGVALPESFSGMSVMTTSSGYLYQAVSTSLSFLFPSEAAGTGFTTMLGARRTASGRL